MKTRKGKRDDEIKFANVHPDMNQKIAYRFYAGKTWFNGRYRGDCVWSPTVKDPEGGIETEVKHLIAWLPLSADAKLRPGRLDM